MKNKQFHKSIDIRFLGDHDQLWGIIQKSTLFSIYHTKTWENLIEKTFKHRGLYVAALTNGNLVDVLPLFLVRKFILGKKLVSTPYEGCSGGFSSQQVEVWKALIERILNYAQQSKVRYIEIRSKFPISELIEFGFIEKRPFIISEVPLLDLDKNWQMLSPKHRRNVRTAKKNGVTVEQTSSLAEMKIFYKILGKHYKELGVPFFGEDFFIQIWEKLAQKEHASLLLAKLNEEIIGGHLLFFSGKTLISKYAAVRKDEEFSKLYASYALFWEGIRLGINNNYKDFSLGVTGESNAGLLDFKSRFGSETHPVYFYYYPIKGKIPDFAKYYGEYYLLKKAWQNIPNFLASPIGQKINEWIC